ncbi:MAG: permease [Clostridiales bacterium]|nr:permease [Clostridiales bacterium]
MKKRDIILYIVTATFLIFALVSVIIGFEPGKSLLKNFWEYIKFILIIMPAVYLLIGLFKVWVKKETVIKHMGHNSGIKGYVLAVILAFAVVGGLFAALPISKQLHDKGSRLGVIMTYLGASCVCRLPMTLFEASLLGWEFTAIRFLVSLPLIILSSIFMEKVFGKNTGIPETVVNT